LRPQQPHPLDQKFKFHCLDGLGRSHRGSVCALTVEAAVTALRERGFRILDLHSPATAGRINYPSVAKLGLIFEQLSMTLHAGIPLAEAMEYLGQDQPPRVRTYLQVAWLRLCGGESFAQSLPLDRRPWHRAVYGVAKAGEDSGNLPEALAMLGEAITRDQQQRRQMAEALAYPLILLLTLIGVVWILSSFALPRYIDVFTTLGVAPPWSLQVVVFVGKMVSVLVPTVTVVALVGSLGSFLRARYRQHSSWFAPMRLVALLPGIGPILRETEYGKIAFVLAMMQRAGVSLPQALAYAKEMTLLAPLQKDLHLAENALQGGATLYEALALGGYLPRLFLRCVRMGEISGTLAEQLDNVYKYYYRQAAYRSKIFFALFQPAMILVVGIVVAAFVLAVFLPVVSLLGAF
jgi:general secretion pathway protein F